MSEELFLSPGEYIRLFKEYRMTTRPQNPGDDEEHVIALREAYPNLTKEEIEQIKDRVSVPGQSRATARDVLNHLRQNGR